jgi:hypothetical protein
VFAIITTITVTIDPLTQVIFWRKMFVCEVIQTSNFGLCRWACYQLSYALSLVAKFAKVTILLTVLRLDVWDILVAEEWHITIQSGSCPEVKSEHYDRGILCTIG